MNRQLGLEVKVVSACVRMLCLIGIKLIGAL